MKGNIMDERYYALYVPRRRATTLERTTLQSLLWRYQGELSNLKAEARGYDKLNKAEKAYLLGKQEATKAHIREIKALLEGGL